MATTSPTTNIRVVPSLIASSYTGAGEGDSVDTRGFRNCLVILDAGEATMEPGEEEGDPEVPSMADISLEASNDNSTWAALSGASFVQVTPSNDNATYVGQVNCDLNKRYLRAVSTVAGNATFAVSFVLMGAESAPVSQLNTVAFTK